MKHENFPQTSPFDTDKMRRLRDQLAEAELVESDSNVNSDESGPMLADQAVNLDKNYIGAVDEQVEEPTEHYTPEEAHELVETLDKMHRESVVENYTPDEADELLRTVENIHNEAETVKASEEVEREVEKMEDEIVGKETIESSIEEGIPEPVKTEPIEPIAAENVTGPVEVKDSELSESDVSDRPESHASTESGVSFEPTAIETAARKDAGNALADIEIAFGNESHDLVQAAREMYKQVLAHLDTEHTSESSAAWEKSLQQKLTNLQGHRDAFVGPDGQKINAEDPMDAVMPNAYLLQPELAKKRRAEILAESGVSEADSIQQKSNESGKASTEGLVSLESGFSDASFTAEVPETDYVSAADARRLVRKKNFKPSGVPLAYDPTMSRDAKKKPKSKRKGFFARLFGG